MLVVVMEVGIGWTRMLAVVEVEEDVGLTNVLVTACTHQKKQPKSCRSFSKPDLFFVVHTYRTVTA